ncbi:MULTISPECIES: allophanate hydrolase subunit 1 [unclassified Amycolatopsis]|uniref:5-oxoprolinase subunit B family protein n=1 Tax=unclassified Amycolatopsis TaxID=2618356 RepID=UPI00287547E1|nr:MULTISPECIES: allophanate hydrolase subunit 1 [unclassified Amycolatopsis]MDS0133290.1 allophanate hydrolase subunit 1 [Amycolatopsis sp. 505]MDS0146520.1 allophanate hydrolase subunit 1 [Amycolatopsis sp. CM201R]
MTVRLLPCGRRAVLVETADVLGYQTALAGLAPDGVEELVPAARTLLVRFDPAVTNADKLGALLREVSPVDSVAADAGEVVVPVVYDGEDLADVAAETGMSVPALVSRHTAGTYVSAFCGFAPGFAYLTGSDPALHVSRRSSPRTRIPPGSVAIAGEYSAVYPSASPGGWRLLGRTDVPVWDVERDPPNLLPPGTRVRFTAVRS